MRRLLLLSASLLASACPTVPGDDDDVSDDDDGACSDEDGDGVCDDDDLCPGGDDAVDLDGDGTPAWCDPTPEQVGHAEDLGGDSSHAVNILLGTLHTLTEDGVLQGVGVIGRRNGPAFRIGIYSDTGGTPDVLIADIAGGDLRAGSQTIPTEERLVGAGDYWVMGLYDGAASIGESGPQDRDTRLIEHEFADPMPAVWPDFDYLVPAARINVWFDIGR
jgi:hypothetical protein